MNVNKKLAHQRKHRHDPHNVTNLKLIPQNQFIF